MCIPHITPVTSSPLISTINKRVKVWAVKPEQLTHGAIDQFSQLVTFADDMPQVMEKLSDYLDSEIASIMANIAPCRP